MPQRAGRCRGGPVGRDSHKVHVNPRRTLWREEGEAPPTVRRDPGELAMSDALLWWAESRLSHASAPEADNAPLSACPGCVHADRPGTAGTAAPPAVGSINNAPVRGALEENWR